MKSERDRASELIDAVDETLTRLKANNEEAAGVCLGVLLMSIAAGHLTKAAFLEHISGEWDKHVEEFRLDKILTEDLRSLANDLREEVGRRIQ